MISRQPDLIECHGTFAIYQDTHRQIRGVLLMLRADGRTSTLILRVNNFYPYGLNHGIESRKTDESFENYAGKIAANAVEA